MPWSVTTAALRSWMYSRKPAGWPRYSRKRLVVAQGAVGRGAQRVADAVDGGHRHAFEVVGVVGQQRRAAATSLHSGSTKRRWSASTVVRSSENALSTTGTISEPVPSTVR